jgi:glycosyltransferase involved in cell wall biosynthesis
MRISGCIITKNEEKNIAKCLGSLKRTVDEIIIVDTGSEDGTVRIAEDLGAHVFKQNWENDFSKAKNSALDRARGDWIVFLDADEYFDETSVSKVRPVIEKAHPDRQIGGIKCEIVNIDKDSGKIISRNEILRIFRNDKKIRYISKIHEEIRNNGDPLKCADARGTLTVMHTGYSASLQAEKARRNLELLENNMEDKKSAYYLATTYYILDDDEKAYRYADAALADAAVSAIDSIAYKMHVIRISSAMRLEPSNTEKLRRLVDEAKRKYGDHPEVAKEEAACLLLEKRYGEALEKYLYALACQEKYGGTLEQNDFPAVIHEVYGNIAQILRIAGNEKDALDYFVKALQADRYYGKAFRNMFALFRSLPDEDVVAFLNSLYDPGKEADLRFLSEQAADCGRPVIAMYYAKKLQPA